MLGSVVKIFWSLRSDNLVYMECLYLSTWICAYITIRFGAREEAALVRTHLGVECRSDSHQYVFIPPSPRVDEEVYVLGKQAE